MSSFNPCSSLPSVATDARKQFQWLNIVFKNKTGALFFIHSFIYFAINHVEYIYNTQ